MVCKPGLRWQRPNELLQDFVHQQYQDLPSMCFFPMRCVDNLDSKSSKLRTEACFNPFTRADNCTVSFCCFHATYDQKQYRARPFQPPMPLTVIPQWSKNKAAAISIMQLHLVLPKRTSSAKGFFNEVGHFCMRLKHAHANF